MAKTHERTHLTILGATKVGHQEWEVECTLRARRECVQHIEIGFKAKTNRFFQRSVNCSLNRSYVKYAEEYQAASQELQETLQSWLFYEPPQSFMTEDFYNWMEKASVFFSTASVNHLYMPRYDTT